jgi:hypothetical protein
VPVNSSCSNYDDGIYLRQPVYDDINGQPHYIRHVEGTTARRHLFFSSNRCWVVAPQCNEDEGSFISSQDLIHWSYIPADRQENGCKFSIRYSEVGNEQKKDEMDDGDSSGVYNLELLPWQDSNHECILFNNEAHTVVFLSAKPSKMMSQMHPMLLRHLQQNGISVQGGDEAADVSTDSLWKILSSLTGIQRSAKEATQLLGGSYCLTGDSLLKILAIVYRYLHILI